MLNLNNIKEQAPYKYTQNDVWESQNYFHSRVINSMPHTLVKYFFNLTVDMDRIINRYTHLYPGVNKGALKSLLTTPPNHFLFGGCDLFYVTETKKRGRKMILLETTSCPSGQKSMPNMKENDERGGYYTLVKDTIKPWYESCLEKKLMPEGVFVVRKFLFYSSFHSKNQTKKKINFPKNLKTSVFIISIPSIFN